MERCDFGSIMTIIRRYISEDKGMNQIDFTYLLFDTFMCSDEAIDFDFDNGQVCRWMTGQAKVSRSGLPWNLISAAEAILFTSSMIPASCGANTCAPSSQYAL